MTRQRSSQRFGRLACIPLREELAASTPAGPCISYPMTDGWSDRVAEEGVVLVGDAAGWNDPIIGQGLSISMRDARAVADVLTTGCLVCSAAPSSSR